MQILPDRTLDQRLSAMVSLVSGLVLAFAVAIFAGASISGAREDLHQRLLAWSDAIASGGQHILFADDGKAAARTLKSLEAEPQIISATLLRDATVIAAYHSTSSAQQDSEEHWFASILAGLFDRHISVERPIMLDEAPIGKVQLVADLADAWLQLERRLGMICVLAGAGYLLMMFLARRMRRAILRPIGRLAHAVETVSVENRYGVRVAKESNDEIGALVDAFNRMLAQIQTRDAEIEAARAELERRTTELTAANEQLQSEVEERRAAEAALREAKEAAEAAECASRTKSQFLANMSQEIRTPMSSVQGMIELLLATELTPRQRHYAEAVQRSNETLLDVFNGILDFSKVEAGRMEIEAVEFSCRETVGEIVRQISERASRKGLRLTSRAEADVPNRVVGDPSRLRQVLLNLVGNAIKFTERGDVRIHLSVAGRQGDTFALRFAIHDTGVGIAPDSHESIFEAFSQVEESGPAQSGSGLGLTIAKQLVQLMGGEIGVESMPGRGSTFWFTVRVPQARSDALITARQELHEVGPPPKFHGRVLVAVAEPMRRESIARTLAGQGVEVTIAQNGQEALDAVLSGSIDLVFIDCDDAEMDGLAMTRAVRDAHNKTVWRMPIVALGANGAQEERERCLRAGMDDHLAMPLESSQLLGVLARWLPAPDASDAEGDGTAEAIAPEAVTTLEFAAIEQIRSLARDGGQGLLDKVVGLYCESIPQMLTSMQEAARRGDCASLQRAAHALRTSSHNVGAMRLAQLCRDLETGARNGVIRFDRLTALEFEIDSVLNKLKHVA